MPTLPQETVTGLSFIVNRSPGESSKTQSIMASPTPSLVDLATEILQYATSLQEQLNNSSHQQPSFESTGRLDYLDILDNPTAVEARTKLIEASRTLLTLTRGPVDTLLFDLKTSQHNLAILRAIYDLKIAEIVPRNGNISISDLAERLQVHKDGLRRILRFACTQNIFREPADKHDHIEHTAISAAIPSITPIMWLYLGNTMRFMPSCLHFADAISLKTWPRPPITFSDPAGREFWTILKEDEPEGRGTEVFAAAMKTTLHYTQGNPGTSLANAFDWADLGEGAVVVDVGGGMGHSSVSLAKSFPNLRFVVQDMEKNDQPAAELIREEGLAGTGRVKFQTHDFFKAQPEDITALNPSVYLISRVLHDWSDEDSVKILTNLLPIMKQRGAKLIIVERVLPDRPGELPLHYEAQLRAMDLSMFIFFGDARERTHENWVHLFKEVDRGLIIKNVYTPLGSEVSVLQVEYTGGH